MGHLKITQGQQGHSQNSRALVNNYAEMYALYLGLLICYQLGVSNLIIESDSKLLVTWCQKNTSPPWELHDLWKKITVMGDYVSYSIAHVYREANKTADSLAKLGACGVSNTYFGHAELPKSTFGKWTLDTIDLPNWRHPKV